MERWRSSSRKNRSSTRCAQAACESSSAWDAQSTQGRPSRWNAVESRVQVGDAAVLNSTNAGGQGNKSKLTSDHPKIKKRKIIDVVRYVYVNFQHIR